MMNSLGIYKPSNRKTIADTLGWKIFVNRKKPHLSKLVSQNSPVMVFNGETPDWFAQYISDGGIGIVTDCHPSSLTF